MVSGMKNLKRDAVRATAARCGGAVADSASAVVRTGDRGLAQALSSGQGIAAWRKRCHQDMGSRLGASAGGGTEEARVGGGALLL